MSAIVSTSFALDDHLQADGRIYVTETHTDSAGGVHQIVYLASPGMNHASIANARASELSAQLQANEIEGILNGA